MAPRSTTRLLLTALALAGAAESQAPPPIAVRITAPRAGVRDGDAAVIVEATVSDPGVRRAWLTAHGLTREVPVSAGRVRESIPALPGVNRVSLTATRAGAVGRDAVTFFARGLQAELVVWVTWPRGDERLHVRVTDPSYEACRQAHACTDRIGCLDAPWPCDDGRAVHDEPTEAHPRGPSWGMSLTLPPRVGSPWRCHTERLVRATRYALLESPANVARSSHDGDVDALLPQLDLARTPARRSAVIAALDRAAAPLPAATRFRAVAILFPGTAHERRRVFDGVVHRGRTDEVIDVVQVTEGELRAARGGRP